MELELDLTLALTRKCADQLTHAPWHTRPPRLLAQAVLEVGTAVGAGAGVSAVLRASPRAGSSHDSHALRVPQLCSAVSSTVSPA